MSKLLEETVTLMLRLSEPERRHARILSGSLMGLDYYVKCFEAAVALFASCWNEQKRTHATGLHAGTGLSRLSQWKLLAARDGVLSLYHIASYIVTISNAAHNIPSIAPAINKAALRSARKKFVRSFRQFEELRDAVAHTADLTKDPDTFVRNAFKGSFENEYFEIVDAKQLMLTDTLSGRCFATTRKHHLLTYEISQAALEKLLEIQKAVCSAFGELEQTIRYIMAHQSI